MSVTDMFVQRNFSLLRKFLSLWKTQMLIIKCMGIMYTYVYMCFDNELIIYEI
jgi:hypothetical protein